MGFMDKMKDWVGLEDEYDEFEETDAVEETAAPATEERKSLETRPSYDVPKKDNRVVNMQRGTSISTHSFKLVVLEPTGFEETPKLVDNLKTKKPVIVNLEKLDSEVARKIFDFLSGATYALNGNVQKVSSNIFIFAPENVDINSSVEHKGFDFQNR